MSSDDSLTTALRRGLLGPGNYEWKGRIWLDGPPESPKPRRPYLTLTDFVGETPRLQGDTRVLARERLMQVELWQHAADESPAVIRRVHDLLDNMLLPGAFEHVYRVRVRNVVRSFEPDSKLTQHVFDVAVTHNPHP